MESSRTYFTKRAREERAKAAKASSEKAKKAHLELACRYAAAAELYEAAASSGSDPATSDLSRSGASKIARELGQVLVSAFPLPPSGAFPDLVQAIDESDWQTG